tara:strand:- start:630 stop:1853 length:1224 start_codon:yes stop_codon:yes gene_type:complete
MKGDIELDQMHPKDGERLIKFNGTKQRVVNLCNKEFEDDPFDQAKNYSTWHRALEGNEVWKGIVLSLEGLTYLQEKYPWRYLPDDPPEEGLHTWMKELNSADWWMNVLEPEASPSAFRAWFSNRPMGKKKIEDVRARVDEWWARLQEQVALVRRYTFAEERQRNFGEEYLNPRIDTWDTWCNDRLEDGMNVEQAREAMVEEATLLNRYNCQLMDLANPQGLTPRNHTQRYFAMHEEDARQQFDKLLKEGFPLAKSRTPPEFDVGPFITEHQWGDRREERCMKDMNVELYNMWYRQSTTQWWDADTREVKSESEIMQVSHDGENWRPANEREKRGWDSGEYWISYAFEHDNADLRNSYQRERDELLAERSVARKKFEYSADGSEYEAEWKANLDRIEDQLSSLHLRVE